MKKINENSESMMDIKYVQTQTDRNSKINQIGNFNWMIFYTVLGLRCN